MVFFVADTHFFHDKIIELCHRPFNNSKEMNEALINNWNAVVSHDDTVYHLGDFALGGSQVGLKVVFDRLNGNKFLARGNHDRQNPKNYKDIPWVAVFDTKNITIDGHQIWLSHYAHRVWPGSHRGSYHLYGHSHGKLPPSGRSMDVGVDCGNFTPWSWEHLKQKLDSEVNRDQIVDTRGESDTHYFFSERDKSGV
jgi:calcineurin-like phosphoesterase family protein